MRLAYIEMGRRVALAAALAAVLATTTGGCTIVMPPGGGSFCMPLRISDLWRPCRTTSNAGGVSKVGM